MPNAIEAEGLAKRYVLGMAGGNGNLRETLSNVWRRGAEEGQHVWALRDISMTIDEGETVGIVGRNGAGKSTLLRILARITEPTAGWARTSGRVGALLEVGTGFHPELTGAENIYLGGAILGMRRSDVRRRYQDIVGFAGVEAFLDTPVKRFSSGMYLRLAFSVAAHLEPAILLVDEVLAVGDAEFQRRCMGKMTELGDEGRTVVFVSHDAGAVTELCSRAIWLEGGELVQEGEANEIAETYMSALVGRAPEPMPIPHHEGPVVLERAAVLADGSGPRRGEPVRVEVRLAGRAPPGLDVAVYVLDDQGRRIIDDALSDHLGFPFDAGEKHSIVVTLPAILRSGDYALGVWLGTPHEEYLDTIVHGFTIAPRGEDREESMRRARLTQPPVEWELNG
jgi:ABC-type polysaccharide/polyol phosphate transport system ATPase subunit